MVNHVVCILCLFVVTCMVPWCAVTGSPIPVVEHEGGNPCCLETFRKAVEKVLLDT
jgi:hypothetical protein